MEADNWRKIYEKYLQFGVAGSNAYQQRASLARFKEEKCRQNNKYTTVSHVVKSAAIDKRYFIVTKP